MQNVLDNELRYRSIRCSDMSEKEIDETARLFSENYGKWSKNSPINPGKQIRFSPRLIRENFVEKPDRYVSLVYRDDELVGHVFYLRREVEPHSYITWMLQLVVKKEYRGYHIGTKLMHSIWELSDSYACGLFTSNPSTIRALENATMRKVNVRRINAHIDRIKSVAFDIFGDTKWLDSYQNGMVDTNFYTDHSDLENSIARAYKDETFPMKSKLPEGYEWLAFTFKRQEPQASTEQLNMYMEFSESILVEAYSNMKMEQQPWAKHAEKEVEFISRMLPEKCSILDIGCGRGRHSVAFAKKGYRVHGIDFSQKNIDAAKRKTQNENVTFEVSDARGFRSREVYDAALCLYDVVGSYPEEKDNYSVLRTAYYSLKKDGLLVLSVMNMDITRKHCQKHGNIINGAEANIRQLLKLRGSRTMQNTGDVFDGKRIVLDEGTGICYRKEQFFLQDRLPVEYIIRDRRYTKESIFDLVEKAGFFVEEYYCFQAGRMDEPLHELNEKAKEIIVIARKAPWYAAFYQRLIHSEYWNRLFVKLKKE